jgi:hypothetical protein
MTEQRRIRNLRYYIVAPEQRMMILSGWVGFTGFGRADGVVRVAKVRVEKHSTSELSVVRA